MPRKPILQKFVDFKIFRIKKEGGKSILRFQFDLDGDVEVIEKKEDRKK